MKKIRNMLLVLLLVLGLAVQVCAVDGETGVPEEDIVYKQDKLYVYVAPAWGVEELYCQVQYGLDNSYETSRMTPVGGKENVWVIDNLPDEITHICPIFYDNYGPSAFGGFEISAVGDNDNMCLCYSTGYGEWCTYDPDAHYEEATPDDSVVPDEDVDQDGNISETMPTEPMPEGVVDMGSCGEKATYTLYDDGLLVIEGEGAVDDGFFGSDRGAGRTDFSRVEIRDGITHLGRDLFYLSSVVEVDMADTVISMGNETGGNIFGSCAKLESIKLSENLTEISMYTFAGCSSLKEIVIPDSVTSIGEFAFGECTNLSKVTVGKGITVIDELMFYTNENLSEVILSEGLITIEKYAFSGTKLKTIEIPDTVTTIGRGAFSFIEELESIQLSENLKEIPYEMCRACTGLKEVIIPEGVEIIGASAFSDCSSLEEVVIPDSVTSLNGNAPWTDVGCDRGMLGAFSGCTNLKSITFGKGCEWIPWGFLDSDVLETLIIPEGVKIIDNYAFSSCPSLTYVEIPASVEYIGGFAFVNDLSLTNIVFKGDPPDQMGGMMGICGDYITASFYPKDAPGWEEAYTGTAAMIPYTLDAAGNIIPEAPEKSEVLNAMERFRSGEYFNYVRDLSAGKAYPNTYRYYINGNYHEGKGSEAFAFELSDACFGFLPISDHRDVVYSKLQVGDLLYMGDQVWVIGAINAEGVKVHGAENEVIVYDKALTKAQVEAADSYRTRYGVSPGPGVVNPDTKLELAPIPESVPTEAEVYQRIIALKENYPEGMPWTEKNLYTCNVDIIVKDEYAEVKEYQIENNGHGCSAFGYLASDVAFGTLPVRYTLERDLDYDDIMVGDNLLGYNHEVVVLEVYDNCLIVAEGNYGGIMHWGRIMTREEVEEGYDLFTRYPEGTVAPQRGYYEIPEEPEETLPPETAPTEPTEPEETVPPTEPTEPEETVPPTEPTEPEETVPPTEPEETIPMDNPFTDIGEDKAEKPYYYQPVMWAVTKGITTGTSDTTFAPDSDCTRGQIVTFIWRAKGEPEPLSTVNPFKDVKPTDYFYKAVLWAVENGITNGLSANEFGPQKGCTRGQVCTFLWRAQGQPAPQNANSPFSDVTGDYYYKAVLWAVENGITNGMGGGKFAPNSTCTRGQIVTFLYRAIA